MVVNYNVAAAAGALQWGLKRTQKSMGERARAVQCSARGTYA
jgi:hypothetical protein